MPAMNYFLNV